MIAATFSTAFTNYVSLMRFSMKRDSIFGKFTHALFFAFTAIGYIVAWQLPELKQLGYILSLVSLAGLLLGYWATIAIGFMLQNSPANAMTVPYLRKRILRLTVLLCTSFGLFFACIAATMFGHFLIFFVLSIATLMTLLAYSGYLYSFYFVALFTSEYWMPFLLNYEHQVQAIIIILVAACTYTWLCLQSAFRHGGDQHYKLYKGLNHLIKQADSNNVSSMNFEKFDRIQAVLGYFYYRELRHIKNLPATPNTFLSIGFGLGFHWCATLFLNFFGLIFAIAMLLFEETKERTEFLISLQVLMIPIMFSWIFTISCKVDLYKTRKEQAILLLAPCMSNGSAINKCLAQVLLKRFIQVWAISLFSITILLLLGYMGNLHIPLGFCASIILCPILFIHNFCDYSQCKVNTGNLIGMAGFIPLIITLCFALSYGTGAWFSLAMLCVSLILVMSTWIGIQRWKSMLTGPLLLPVDHRNN